MIKQILGSISSKPMRKQWLWFVGLYLSSVAVLGLFSYFVKFMLSP